MLDKETERIFTFYNVSIVFCSITWALANVPYESHRWFNERKKWIPAFSFVLGERRRKRRKQVTFECSRILFDFTFIRFNDQQQTIERMSNVLIRFGAAIGCDIFTRYVQCHLTCTKRKKSIFLAHLIQKTWCHNDSPDSSLDGWSENWETPLSLNFLWFIFATCLSVELSRRLWTRLYLGFCYWVTFVLVFFLAQSQSDDKTPVKFA